MPNQKLTEMDTSALKPGAYFKAGRRWYLADGFPESTSDNPAHPEWRIPAYDVDGVRALITYLPDRVGTTRGSDTPEVFKRHKLLSHADQLEKQAVGLYNRAGRIRAFAAALESRKEV